MFPSPLLQSHRQTHHSHAISRAKTRYGLTHHRIPEIAEEIESGASWHLHTQKDGREVHCVIVSKREVLVIWNPENKFIVTVLPTSAHGDYAKELKAYRESEI